MPDPINGETVNFLQYGALVVGSAVGAAIAAFFGVRARMRRNGDSRQADSAPHRIGGGVEVYVDGVVIKALETFQAIYREIKQLREDAARHADERNKKLDNQTDLLRDIEDNTRERTGRPTRRG